MNAPKTKQIDGSEGTYRPGNDPQSRALARQMFLLSVLPAAVPVLVAAGMMLQAQHKNPGHSAVANSTRQSDLHTTAKVVAAPAKARPTAVSPALFAAQPAGEHPETLQLSPFEPSSKYPEILPNSSANLDYGIVRLQTRAPERDLLDRDILLNAAPVEREAATPDESGAASRTATLSPRQVKKLRIEMRTHAIARHRHRPQRHVPPSLFAKIGRSIKEALSMR